MARVALGGGIAVAMLLVLAQAGVARTLTVGVGQAYAQPSAAIAAAEEGDTVSIASGTYFDCAGWSTPHLTIAGAGADTVITDKACQGKALLVVGGDGTVIRDLTLARARVPDENGAGIRLDAPSLSLSHVRFVNDQVGLLAGGAGDGRISIEDCVFEQGGVGGERPGFAVNVSGRARLEVLRSTIAGLAGGGISSSAGRTELRGNTLGVGVGALPAAAVLVSAGNLLMQDNVLVIGPGVPRQGAAVWVTGEGGTTLRHNRLDNRSGQPVALLLDWGGGATTLADNEVGKDVESSDTGIWRHRAAGLAHGAVDDAHAAMGAARHLAGAARDGLKRLLGR